MKFEKLDEAGVDTFVQELATMLTNNFGYGDSFEVRQEVLAAVQLATDQWQNEGVTEERRVP